MADTFRLRGEYSALTAVRELGVPAPPEVLALLDEGMYLSDKLVGAYTLASDSPVSVGFSSLSAAHVVILRATSKVRVRLTSSDGSSQALPADPLLVLISSSAPVTALDLTRLTGVSTEVTIFLGERV